VRLRICAVGRARSGPEAQLVDDYLGRIDRAGRPHGLGPADVVEIEDKRGGGPVAEASLLERSVPGGAAICALDERGRMLSSPQLAERVAAWRDAGRPCAAFLVGGADGLDPDLVARADTVLSLGPMVWPHMLARAMLAEQLYRSVTILAGSPYHRA
jgi:23S rRNA (pseudouridine1915-N3)-methyltransferase